MVNEANWVNGVLGCADIVISIQKHLSYKNGAAPLK